MHAYFLCCEIGFFAPWVHTSGSPNDSFFLNALKTLIRLSSVSLERHSKRHYEICICSIILGQLESFRNYKGFSIIFPKMPTEI